MDAIPVGTLDSPSVVLGGNLTIRDIDAVHATLAEAVATRQRIEIDCAAATAIDLSFVQILLAARKRAQAAGKTLTLAQPASGLLLDVLRRGGFLAAGPQSAHAADAFWTKAEEAE